MVLQLRKSSGVELFSKHVPAFNTADVPLATFPSAILGSASRQTTAAVKSPPAVLAGSSILVAARFFNLAPILPGPGAAIVGNNKVFVGIVQVRFSSSAENFIRIHHGESAERPPSRAAIPYCKGSAWRIKGRDKKTAPYWSFGKSKLCANQAEVFYIE
jgi:hypothetical protein